MGPCGPCLDGNAFAGFERGFGRCIPTGSISLARARGAVHLEQGRFPWPVRAARRPFCEPRVPRFACRASTVLRAARPSGVLQAACLPKVLRAGRPPWGARRFWLSRAARAPRLPRAATGAAIVAKRLRAASMHKARARITIKVQPTSVSVASWLCTQTKSRK